MTQREWINTPKTKPENVHILYFDAHLDGSGGWIRCNAKVQLSKRMYAWGESKGTLLAEIVNEEDVQAISGLWVLKRFLGDQAPDIEMGVVRRQAIACQWASLFQGTSPRADAPFLKMVLLQLIQRKGKPLARMEELVEGHYDRFMMKAKKHLVSREELEMLKAFEAYVFHQSGQQTVITSVQKVGDRWTEPIFHSKDQTVGGQSDQGEQGMSDWLREFHSTDDSLSDEDPSSPSFVNPSVALPMLGTAGQTFIGDLTDDTDHSPDQSLEVDGLQMSSQRFATHLSSQRRAPSPQPISSSSPLFLSGRSVQDTPLAPIQSREVSRQGELVDNYELQTSSRNGTAYVTAMHGLSRSPRPLGEDAREALDLHLSNRDMMWESRKTASIHNSFSGKPTFSAYDTGDGDKPASIQNSVHSSLDGRKASSVQTSAERKGNSTPQNIHTSSGSRGMSIPLNVHTSTGTRGSASTPKNIQTSSGGVGRTSPAQWLWDQVEDDKPGTDTPLNPVALVDESTQVSNSRSVRPTSALASSNETWAHALKDLTAGGACNLEAVMKVTRSSVSVQQALHDCAAQEYHSVILAPGGGDERAVAVEQIVAGLLLGHLKAGDPLLTAQLPALPTISPDASLLACADLLLAPQQHHSSVAVLDQARGSRDPVRILGLVSSSSFLAAIAPPPAPSAKPAPTTAPAPASPIVSVLLNSADSNPRDPAPSVLALEPPAFPPPQPPLRSAQDRAALSPPASVPVLPPPTSPPALVALEAPRRGCALLQWQRASLTQGLTLLLFSLDLVLLLLAAPAGSAWGDASSARWHSTAAFLLALALVPEAAARCRVHPLSTRASTPQLWGGSFPGVAARLSSSAARGGYMLLEAFDVVVLAFALVLFPSLAPRAIHPRLGGGGTFFAVLRALRLLRLVPWVAETWKFHEDEPQGGTVEVSEEHSKQVTRAAGVGGGGGQGAVEPGRDSEVVNPVKKTESWLRDQAKHSGAAPVEDLEIGTGTGGKDSSVAGRHETGTSVGAASDGAGNASAMLNNSAAPNSHRSRVEVEEAFSIPDPSVALSMRSPTLLESATTVEPSGGVSLLSPTMVEASQLANSKLEEEEDEEEEDLPLPTQNYARGSPAGGKFGSLSGRPRNKTGSPSLSPSLTSSLRGVSPSQLPPNVIVTGSLVNDHHPSKDLTAGAEGKAWMVNERPSGTPKGAASGGGLRPPLHPGQPPRHSAAARKLSGSMRGDSRDSSSGEGTRAGFVSLFPDPK